MQKKSIKKNYLYNLSYQILAVITPLITAPYLARVLGADGIGEFSYASSICAYFVYLALNGTSRFGQRQISYVQNESYNRSVQFWEVKIFSFVTSFIVLLLYIPFALQQTNNVLLLILSLNIVNAAFDIAWFFQGMEEFKLIVLRNTIFKLIQITFIFLFVKEKSDLALYTFGHTGLILLSSLSLWGYLRRFIEKVRIKDLHPFKNTKVIFSLFLPTIAMEIYSVLDKTMIGMITKESIENGYYEQAMNISRTALTIVTALGTVMVPRIGNMFSQGNKAEVQNAMYRSYRFVWFIGIPMCLGLIGISSNFVPWFFGPGYDGVIPLLRILSVIIIAVGISNVTGVQYLIPTKKEGLFTKSVVIGAILNFLLNIPLIYFNGAIGAAIASVVAEVSIALVQILFVRNELSVKRIFSGSIRYLISGIIMLGVLLLERSLMKPSLISTILMIVSGGAVYMLEVFIFCDAFFLEYYSQIVKRFRRG